MNRYNNLSCCPGFNNEFGVKLHTSDRSKEISNCFNEYFTNAKQSNMYNQIKHTRQNIHNIVCSIDTKQLTTNTSDISFNKFS